MRLLRLAIDFTISHVPGKELTPNDALSRALSNSTSRVKQEEEIELCVENILLQLPASDKRLEKLPSRKSKDQPTESSLSIPKRAGQTRSKRFQARSVHTGVQEARFSRGNDFSSKALILLFRHR